MYKLLLVLHVLTAVLLVGPFVVAAFSGRRGIRRGDPDATGMAARSMAWFSIGTLVVAVLGAGVLSLSDRYSFGTPWVLISITLYIVTLGVATGYAVPALRKAAQLVQRSVAQGPAATGRLDAGPGDAATEVSLPTPTDVAQKERLDNLARRVSGAG